MSRSKKGGKGPGHEYWGKRPGPTDPGKESKSATHSLERIEGKEEVVEQLSTHYEGELTEAMIEDAAIRSAANMGAAQDIWHPDYGWIMLKGELTDAGIVFCQKYYPIKEQK